jgi:CRP-like cAMP-binding protein
MQPYNLSREKKDNCQMSRSAEPFNALLQVFDEDILRELGATTVEVKSGDVLQRAGNPEEHAYFPLTAVISLVSTTAGGGSVEVSMVGREGVAGLSGMFAADSPTENIVELGGTCVRVGRAALRIAHAQHPCARMAFDRYTTARVIQMARLAACHRLHPIGGRLARWLLALHDRAQCDTFRLSQQRLSDLLGAHRPTIATELQRLHAARGIRYTGRLITIADRARLETLACDCHQALHREYLTLVSWAPPDRGDDDPQTRKRDEMLATISHELRTPLQAILGWCAVGAGNGSAGNALSVIERNARAQLRVIEEKLEALAGKDGRR